MNRPLFERAFGPGLDSFSLEHVTQALASFERTIISASSPYDRYHNERDDTAISPAAPHGETPFFSQPLSCFRCHGGFTFSGATDFEGRRERGEVGFHNTGLYNLAERCRIPRRTPGSTRSRANPKTSGSSRRRRCATLR